MTTTPIEAGARAADISVAERLARAVHWIKRLRDEEYLDDGGYEELDAFIRVAEREAASTASAVAEMRERCAKVADKENAHSFSGRSARACERVATAIRQLDLPPAGGEYVLVPRIPSRGLLISMAMRMDHAFAAPAQEIGGVTLGYTDAYREVVLADLAKAYEEVVGAGFYKPEREAKYCGMLAPKGDAA